MFIINCGKAAVNTKLDWWNNRSWSGQDVSLSSDSFYMNIMSVEQGQRSHSSSVSTQQVKPSRYNELCWHSVYMCLLPSWVLLYRLMILTISATLCCRRRREGGRKKRRRKKRWQEKKWWVFNVLFQFYFLFKKQTYSDDSFMVLLRYRIHESSHSCHRDGDIKIYLLTSYKYVNVRHIPSLCDERLFTGSSFTF